MSKVTPFLMFNHGVKEAFEYYQSVFTNSKILSMMETAGMANGEIEIEGQRIIGFDGGDHFTFTEGFSLMIDCEDQTEVDYYWEKLAGNGGEESQCGWVKDRWGLSWQIVPKALGQTVGGSDPAGRQRAMEAMMQMKKLEVDALWKAYRGE